MCCVEGNIYLLGGYPNGGDDVTEYNARTNTWRNMPSLQKKRWGHSVCTFDNKIFALSGTDTTCEMLDLTDDNPHWRYIPEMNRKHFCDGAVVIERKIYVVGGGITNAEVYDLDQGRLNWFHKVLALIGQTKQQGMCIYL